MTEVTSIAKIEQFSLPGLRMYTFTATDGNTFTCTDFATVTGVVLTYAVDPSGLNGLGYTVSGNVVTIKGNGLSSKKLSALVAGTL